MKLCNITFALAVALLCGLVSESHSATVSLTSQTFTTMNVDLTAEGSHDWMQFGGTASGSGSGFMNEKQSASELAIVLNQANGARGSSGTVSTWTDGTPFPAATSDREIRFVGNIAIPRGITIDANADLVPRVLRMYVSAHSGGNGTLTATLLDSTNAPLSSAIFGTLDNELDTVYELTYSGDSLGDKLRVNWALTSLDGAMGTAPDVTLAAVTLGVPEPTTAMLLFLGIAGGVSLRRRRV